MENSRVRYVVFLRVDVEGPNIEWENVAEMVAARVKGLSLKRGLDFSVVEAEVDTAEDVVIGDDYP